MFALIGIGYVLVGALLIDPNGFTFTLSVEDLALLFSLMAGVVLIAKGMVWAIGRTDLYLKLVKALDSVTQLEGVAKDAERIRTMYERVHKSELQ
jgi:hypothetical protein